MAGENNPLSYAFWAGTPSNSPLSYDALQTRRKIAEQLAGKRSPFPKTFGEGLTYAGERFADVMDMNRLDAAEKQQAAYERQLRGGYPQLGADSGGAAGGSAGNTAVAPAAPAAASRPVSDAGTDTTAPVQTAAAPGQPLDVTPSKFANVRFNNPGAQYPVSGENATAFGQQGAGTIGGGHKIAQFPTPVHGAAANMDLLDRNYTGTTIGDAINKWSGGGRRNVPGFNTDTVITKELMRDPSFAIPFMQAVAGGEAPGRYPMSGEQWAQAHNMFTGARGAMPPPLPPSDPRGRITQAITDQAEPPVRTAALTTPGVASDAGPASAIADGASTAIAALPVQAQPPTQGAPGQNVPPTVLSDVQKAPTPAGATVPPPILPRDPGPEPVRPPPTPAMLHLEGLAKDRGLSPDTRAQAQAKYNELYKAQQDVYINDRNIWKQEVIKFHDPATGLGLREKQLAVVKAVQDLEGEGWRPVPAEKMAQLPKVAEGQTYWENRRGELKFGPRPPATTTVNIDQKAEGKGLERLQTEMADHIVGQFKEGTTAADDLRTLSGMRALAARVDTGAPAVIKQFAGKFGIKTEGISDIEALNATINRIVPQQRVPGTGATSDFDARMFQASVPHLMNTKDGNMLIMDTMENVAKNKLARAEVAGKVISGDLKIADGTRELLKLQAEAKTISDNVRSYLENTGVKLPESIIPSQTDADEAARKFLRENPNHPRAEGVRRALGIR